MPALLYGFFACYAVTGKCELRTDSQGRDLAVFTSLEDCQRFGSGPAQQPPNGEGKWVVADDHYYQCLRMTPSSVPAAATLPATAPTAKTGPTAAAAVTGAAAAGAAVAGAAAAETLPAAAKPPTVASPAPPAPPPAAAAPTAAAPTTAAASTAAVVAMPAAAMASHSDASRPVYKTTAEALQHDFATNPEGLKVRIGNALVEVSGTVAGRADQDTGMLQLSGGTSDVTAWLAQDEVVGARFLSKRAHVTLSCDRIGTLVAASGRRPGMVEIRDCRFLNYGG